MKEITMANKIYLEQFDVYVNQYLTVSQIQQIVNAISKFDSWSEREQNKNILVLYHATNMGQENIENYDYDILQSSGLIDSVIANIKNYNEIEEAINWTESIQRALILLSKELPTIIKPLKEVAKYGTTNKK